MARILTFQQLSQTRVQFIQSCLNLAVCSVRAISEQLCILAETQDTPEPLV